MYEQMLINNFGITLGMISLTILNMIFIFILLFLAITLWVDYQKYKALKFLGYENSWLVFIPIMKKFALQEATKDDKSYTTTLDCFEISNSIYQFYWLIFSPLLLIPKVGTFLYFIVNLVFEGTAYTKLFVKLSGTTYGKNDIAGYFSVAFPIVAAFKLINLDYTNKSKNNETKPVGEGVVENVEKPVKEPVKKAKKNNTGKKTITKKSKAKAPKKAVKSDIKNKEK